LKILIQQDSPAARYGVKKEEEEEEEVEAIIIINGLQVITGVIIGTYKLRDESMYNYNFFFYDDDDNDYYY
jgi:hypothetical protein